MFGYIKTRPNVRTSEFRNQDCEYSQSRSGPTTTSQTAGYLSWESISYFFGKWTDEAETNRAGTPANATLEETRVDLDQNKQTTKQLVAKMEHTTDYTVTTFDTLPKIALKFDITPSELTRLNKLVSRTLYPGQVLKVPCSKTTEDCSEIPGVSPGSPKSMSMDHHSSAVAKRVSFDDIESDVLETFIKVKSKYITDGQGVVKGFLIITPHAVIFHPDVSEILIVDKGAEYYQVNFPMDSICAAGMFDDIAEMVVHEALPPGHFFLDEPLIEWLRESNVLETEDGKQAVEEVDSDSTLHQSLSTTDDSAAELGQCDSIDDSAAPSELSPEKTVAQDILNDLLERVNQTIDQHAEITENVPADSSNEDTVVSSSHHRMQLQISTDHPLAATDPLDGSGHVTDSSHMYCVNSSTPKQNPYCGRTEGKDEDFEDYSEGISKDSGIDEHYSRESVRAGDSPLTEEDCSSSWKKLHSRSYEELDPSDVAPRPSTCHVDMPKYLCLRIKKACWPAIRPRLCSHAHQAIQKANDERREYWFSIPSARLFEVYGFFLEMCPAIHDGETDEEMSETENDDLVGSCSSSDYCVISLSEGDEAFKLVDDFYSRSPDKKNMMTNRKRHREKKKKKKNSPTTRKSSSWSVCTLEEPVLPDLIGKSDILTESEILQLSQRLPSRTVGHSWRLVYSTSIHGISLKTLYRCLADYDSPTLLVIRDKPQKVFGAFASSSFAVSDHFYGTGECFLFSFHPEFRIYRWSGDNNFFIKGDIDSLAFGGGQGNFGLWLDEDLYYGSSHPCKTFTNDPLTVSEDFICSAVETWCFE